MENPFFLFPEEVWEMILHSLDDSIDAWNVFRAFPQLDNSSVLQKKKHLWLFGLVVPHLIPWKKTKCITEPMLLKCRRVCRHWSIAVDNYLENQPQLRAYHTNHAESQKERNGHVAKRFHWNTETYLEKNDIDMRRPHIKKPSHLCGFYFDNIISEPERRPKPKSLSKFLQAVSQHPPDRNPFLSRSLSCYIEESETEMETFWNDTVTLHQKFGEHVHFYKIEFHMDYMDLRYPTECLSQLKNLKSFHLICSGYNSEEADIVELTKFFEAVEKNIPELPQLETLRLEAHGELEKLGRLLIDRFSPQIRRLELQMSIWKPEYFNVFPNLTELDLIDILCTDSDKVRNLLMSLEAPQLAKLKLKFEDGEQDEGDIGSWPFSVEDDLFQWLKRFLNLKFLDFAEDCRVVLLEEKGTLDLAKDSSHSLQFLSIRTSFGMTYNFLRCLPSLQHLNLYVPLAPVVNDISGDPVVRIREEIQTAKMYRSNVWEVCPKLRTVTLLVEDLDGYIWASYPFNREDYEKTKNKTGQGSSSGSGSVAVAECDPFREDIVELLKQNKDPMDADSDASDDSSEDDQGDDFDGWPIF